MRPCNHGINTGFYEENLPRGLASKCFGLKQGLLRSVTGRDSERLQSTKHAFSSVVLLPGAVASSQQTPVSMCRMESQHLPKTVSHCRASWLCHQVTMGPRPSRCPAWSFRSPHLQSKEVVWFDPGPTSALEFHCMKKTLTVDTDLQNPSYETADSSW